MPASRLRSMLLRLIALGGSFAVALLLAEFLVAWIAPRAVLLVEPGLYLDDPPRGYRLNPGFSGTITNRVEYRTAVKVNAAGLRGPEIAAREATRPRLLVIGDSYAFGVGAEEGETLPMRLAARLAEAGAPAEVLNGGVPGYSVPDDASWFETWGKPLAPDLVVLVAFAGNDLQDAMPGQRATVVDGQLVVPGGKVGGLGAWLFRHSHLYVMAKTSPLGAAGRRLLGKPAPHESAQVAAELSLYARAGGSEIERVGGAATDAAVDRLVAELPPGRLVALILPSDLSVHPEAFARALAANGLDPAGYDAGRLSAWFHALFERKGIPALDLTARLAAGEANGERLYYPLDRHLTPAGYDMAARELAPVVARELSLPVAPESP